MKTIGRVSGWCRGLLNGRSSSVGTANEAARVAWLEQALKKIPAGGRILDAGAGEQQFRSLCTHLNYVSQDFAQYDGQGDGRGLQMGTWHPDKLDIVCDIVSIPEPESSFDAIMCIEVFEHLPKPLLALKEFSRLLRPGGHLILTAPFCSITHFAPYYFYTGFSRYFFERHLPEFGFEMEEISTNGNFYEYLAQEMRRISDINRRYSSARLRPWELLARWVMLAALRRFSSQEKGSDELLCFGYHVRAVRRADQHEI